MDMTTVRVRRARADTLKACGVDQGGRELAEVTAHGEAVGIVDVDAKQLVWNAPAFDDSVGAAIVRLVKDAVPIMGQARHVARAAA